MTNLHLLFLGTEVPVFFSETTHIEGFYFHASTVHVPGDESAFRQGGSIAVLYTSPQTLEKDLNDANNLFVNYSLPVIFISETFLPDANIAIQQRELCGYLVQPVDQSQIIQLAIKLHYQNKRRPLSVKEPRYQFLLDLSIDGYLMIDLLGNIIATNESYCRMMGYSPEELCRMNIADLEAVESLEDTKVHTQRVISQGGDRFESKHKCADGRIVDLELNVIYNKEEERIYTFCNNISEKKIIERVQLDLLQGVFVRLDESYFEALAQYIASTLQFDYICIDTLSPDNLQATTIANYYNGKFEDNVVYTLHETPCGEVVGNTVCCFPSGVRHLFPNDVVLQEIEAEGYVGSTLWDRNGNPIGLIAAISKKPLHNPRLAETLLKLIAIRAGGELERILMENKGKEQEIHYRALVENMQEGIMEVDNDDRILFVNEKFCKMLGYQSEELLGQIGNELLLSPQDRITIIEKNKNRLKGISELYQIDMIKKSGDVISLLLNATPMYSADGSVNGSMATFIDITEKKDTERKLEASEEQYRTITENAFDVIALIDMQGNYLFCNTAYYDSLGYTPEDVLGTPCFNIIVEDKRQEIIWLFQQAMKEGVKEANLLLPLLCKNGTVKLFEQKARLLINPDGQPERVLLIAQDITEKSHAELILKSRNAVLEYSTSHALDEILKKTLNEVEYLTKSKIGFYHFILEDQKTLSLQAWSDNTTKNMCTAKITNRHYNIDEAGVWAECINQREPVIHNDYAALLNKKGLPEGHAVITREMVVPVMRNNKIVAILGVGNKETLYTHDDVKMVSQLADLAWEIAKNKRAEESLKVTEERYRAISRLSSDFSYSYTMLDDTYKLDWISDAFYTITGYTSDDLSKSNCWVFAAHDDDRQRIFDKIYKLQLHENSEDEFRLVDATGNTHYIVNKMECVPDPENSTGKKLIGAVTDITTRKNFELALEEKEERLSYRLAFEEIISSISNQFIRKDVSSLDSIINDGLEQIGKLIHADRSYVFIFSPDGKYMSNTHEWVAEGVTPVIEYLQNIPTENTPWWYAKINNFESIVLPSLDLIPHEASFERKALEEQDIKSLVVVPMVYENLSIGYVGFDSVVTHREWDDDSLKLLWIFAGVITNSIKRQEFESFLIRSEEKYRKLVQELPDAIALHIDGKLAFVNNAALTLMRAKSADQLLGKSVLDFVHPDSREMVLSRMKYLLTERGEVPVIEEKFIRLDGSEVMVNVRAIPVVYEDKNGVQLIVRDITEQKRSEEEIKILSRAVEQSPVSIIITDLHGNIEYANPRTAISTGYELHELIGKNPRIFSSGELTEQVYDNLWETIINGNEWRGEFHNKRKDGTLFWENASISPIKDISGKFSHFLAVKEDITERKELEQSLMDAKLQAETANSLKDAFIANISHEIRTPLNGILGMSAIIESIFSAQASDEEKQFFTSIESSSHRLMSTIDMILNFSRLQIGEYPTKFNRISLSSIIDHLFKEYKPIAKRGNLDIEIFKSVGNDIIIADEGAILRSLSNVLDNAIKFSEKGTIKVTLYSKESGQINIDIADEGIGISEDCLAKIFEPYTQEFSGFSRPYEGVGLGLSITKQFLELNNASISVISKKNIGSVFTFHFKQAEEILKAENGDSTSIEKRNAAPIANTEKLKILVVEDDAVNQIYIRSILRKNYHVIVASNAIKAWEVICSEELHVILMDISLRSTMNGLELTQKIRSSEYNTKVPIIAVTGHAFPEDLARTIEAGCNDYLTKPFAEEDLLSKITNILNE